MADRTWEPKGCLAECLLGVPQEAQLGLSRTLVAKASIHPHRPPQGPCAPGCCGRTRLQKTMFPSKGSYWLYRSPLPGVGPGDCRGWSASWSESLRRRVSRLAATRHTHLSLCTSQGCLPHPLTVVWPSVHKPPRKWWLQSLYLASAGHEALYPDRLALESYHLQDAH